MANYLFQIDQNNTVHDITYEQIKSLYYDNSMEEREGRKMTCSSYQGESFLDNKSFTEQFDYYREFVQRDSMTNGFQIYYPHGVILEQSMRRNYYRGENQIYPSSVPTLIRTLKKYSSRKDKELYRMVSDMRIYEFSCLLKKFQHVQNWTYSDVLYETLAQHYGLETSWLDITSDFNVALFFACCYYQDKKWMPLTRKQTEVDENHQYGMIFHMPSYIMANRWTIEGKKFVTVSDKVVERKLNGEPYRYETLKHPIYTGLTQNLIYPIGFQPFMRCHMQNGYGIYMRNEQPLQSDSGFEKLRFRHSEELSNWIFDEMKGGELIYPHEGLKQVEFLIQKIKSLNTFSEDAFTYALQRNHLFTVAEKDVVRKEVENFTVDGEHIQIQERHAWHLTPVRRNIINDAYHNFSLLNWYGIQIVQRGGYPGLSAMFEPWMLLEQEDEPGVMDFELRKEVECGSDIHRRDMTRLLTMVMNEELPDF